MVGNPACVGTEAGRRPRSRRRSVGAASMWSTTPTPPAAPAPCGPASAV